ncbi:MAG: pilus assembly protein [Chloroflexi bacterium]|nr:pilus assembly protein [Chloroflexota bacterium]
MSIEKELDMLFYPNERGQGFLEYGMLIILITIVVMIALTIFGRAVGNLFSNVIANV